MLHSFSEISLPRVHLLTVDQTARERIRDWLSAIQQDLSLSPIKLAKIAGVSPTTIYRALDPAAEFTPTTKTLEKIASKTGKPLPGQHSPAESGALRAAHIRPWSSEGIERVSPDNGLIITGDVDDAFRLYYRILDRSLDLEGYLPGDIVEIDSELSPAAGDVVCAELSGGRPVLRLYEPPYLISRSFERRAEPAPTLLDRSVTIRGTARRMFRNLHLSTSKTPL